MTAKKLMILVLAMALIIAIPAVLFADSEADAEAEAEPPTDIEANFTFQDDGTTLTITGTAEGMDSGHAYITLIYGLGSLVEGVNACEPAASIPGSMFIGTWTVFADGTGTLGPVTKTGAGVYSPLSTIATISVRGGTAGPPPVVLCGEVERD